MATRAQIISNTATQNPDNTSGSIEPSNTRNSQDYIANNVFVLDSDDTDDINEGAVNLWFTASERAQIVTNTNSISALQGSLIPQGNWNANTNSPDITGTTQTGYYWIVSVAGSTNLGGTTEWDVNDWAVKVDGGWAKVDNSEKVLSVNGQTGTVVLDASNIAEAGTRVWLTNDAQTIEGKKTFDTLIVGEDGIQGHRPVGTTISSGQSISTLDGNEFYSVNASSGAVSLAVDDASNTAFAIGTEFEFSPSDLTNDIDFTAGGVQAIQSKDGNLKIDGNYSAVVLKKVADNTWRLIGSLKA